MSNSPLRALVVDDEAIARRMVMSALADEGFTCDSAIDGVGALERVEDTKYDLIVTDLCMPNKHGHALSVELLARERVSAPVIVVHTSVDDPRMTKDLIMRGVDDVVYKPTNYAAFAAKMRALVSRRKEGHAAANAAARSPSDLPASSRRDQGTTKTTFYAAIDIKEFDERLTQIGHILPVSEVAIEVLARVRADDSDAHALARLISRDGGLAAELLRLANNGFYNRSGQQIVDLHEAITRVGARRIGEISLAVSALGSLTNLMLPWFDKDLARLRSLAGCMAADRILKCHGTNKSSQGVVFSALIYPLGRIVVGTAYANVYENLLTECQRTALSLGTVERDMFPRSPSAATAQVLSHWGLPSEICAPLIHADSCFESLIGLAEPVRTSLRLLKTAIAFGEFAVGRWMPWDTVEFPSDKLLHELGIDSPGDIIDEVRTDLKSLGSIETDGEEANKHFPEIAETPSKRLAYCNLSTEAFDIAPPLLASMNYELAQIPSSERYLNNNVVVNCLHAPAACLAARRGETDRRNWVMFTNEVLPESFRRLGTCLRLPASYLAIHAAIEQVAAVHQQEVEQSAIEEYAGIGTAPKPQATACLDVNA